MCVFTLLEIMKVQKVFNDSSGIFSKIYNALNEIVVKQGNQ